MFVARRALLSVVKHDLGTRIEIDQHGRPARLNRVVNRKRAAGEIVTTPSY